jgi:hypothetical protein
MPKSRRGSTPTSGRSIRKSRAILTETAPALARSLSKPGKISPSAWRPPAIRPCAGCVPETRGERPEKFEEAQQFEASLFRAVVADPLVHRAMMEVGQLLQPQSLLQEPNIMRRIEAVSAKAAA